ncbi:hypothetical protein P154DRAFT_178542 [Amniculicola lignicola CBS 123094]|uniref:Uncharacterized protein n=1 Tax=Amniculicola lignicola CBS 123094 TaxID=1392246 RepID=A0A6A5X2C1_9PLEO|nr:hypothetical protein P154DRAFT_178542 [Amniculicola lignicola CBS 123094]
MFKLPERMDGVAIVYFLSLLADGRMDGRLAQRICGQYIIRRPSLDCDLHWILYIHMRMRRFGTPEYSWPY